MEQTDLTELERKVEELPRRQRAESQRELDELFAKSGFKNGAEALQGFRDLFDSDEEMEEFGDYLQQMREEEARPLPRLTAVARIVLDTDVVSYHRAGRLPDRYAGLVAANQHCITFATAGGQRRGRPRPLTTAGSRPAASRASCRC